MGGTGGSTKKGRGKTRSRRNFFSAKEEERKNVVFHSGSFCLSGPLPHTHPLRLFFPLATHFHVSREMAAHDEDELGHVAGFPVRFGVSDSYSHQSPPPQSRSEPTGSEWVLIPQSVIRELIERLADCESRLRELESRSLTHTCFEDETELPPCPSCIASSVWEGFTCSSCGNVPRTRTQFVCSLCSFVICTKCNDMGIHSEHILVQVKTKGQAEQLKQTMQQRQIRPQTGRSQRF